MFSNSMNFYNTSTMLLVFLTLLMTVTADGTVSLNLDQVNYTDYVTPIDLDDVYPHYDMIVVGSGMSGASVAYHYRQLYPHKKILVIEKRDKPVSGATGRNTGVLFATPDNENQIECVQMLLDLIHNNSLDVELVRKDYANLFMDNQTFALNKQWYYSLSPEGQARTTIWDADMIVQELNMTSGRFVGGLTFESYQFNSYKLTMELLRLSDADIVVNVSVAELDYFSVTLDDSNIHSGNIIRARRVIDCRGWEGDDSNMIPVRLQVISSTPMQQFLSYSFYSDEGFGLQRPDGRVLFGGFGSANPNGGFYENDDSVLDPAVSAALRQGFTDYFNINETFDIEYEWTGIIAYLPDGPKSNAHALFGFSGAGLSDIFFLALEKVVKECYRYPCLRSL